MSLWKVLTGRWGSGAGEVDEVRIDASTNSLQVVDYAHHEIHAGSTFRVQANDTAASLTIAFKVPAGTKYPHFICEWSAASTGYIQLLEGVTITASTGTDTLIKNSNRNSASTSILQGYSTGAWVANYVTVGPTITGGTVISDKRFYADDKTGGMTGARRAEIVLADDTEYALEFTSTDGSQGIQLRCEWYEHTDKH